jgi:cell division septal protein FtsQ
VAAASAPGGAIVDLRRFAPSGPSLVVGFVLLALGLGSYGLARETALFEIRTIEVLGGPADVRSRVAAALEPLQGESLVGLRREELDRRIAGLPDVVGVSHDRAFPHTLRVFVLPERPLVVLRRGPESWLVSARSRVVRPVAKGALPALPRVWVARSVAVAAGDTLGDATAVRAIRVIALAQPALPPIRTVRIDGAETTVVLRSGVEVRLGREQDLALKLAVAAQVLPETGAEATYVDVSVPDRPVADGVSSSGTG